MFAYQLRLMMSQRNTSIGVKADRSPKVTLARKMLGGQYFLSLLSEL